MSDWKTCKYMTCGADGVVCTSGYGYRYCMCIDYKDEECENYINNTNDNNVFEIYDKKTGKTVDIKTNSDFKNHGVVIELDGKILLTYYGEGDCNADMNKYGVRVKIN